MRREEKKELELTFCILFCIFSALKILTLRLAYTRNYPLTKKEPDDDEASNKRLVDLAALGQKRPLAFRVFRHTHRLHQLGYCREHGKNSGDQQVDRNETLNRTVAIVQRSCRTHFRQQAGRRLDSAPSPNVVAMATRVGSTTFCMVPLNRPSPKTPL